MEVSQLPLNALRAFEASARLLSFTRAGLELHVSQTAVSHQVKALEEVLGVSLFERLPRGVALTDEGHALLPVLTDAFRRMSATLRRFEDGNFREVLTVGAVGTFATGWLLPNLERFSDAHPHVDLRLKTNNNRADILADGLDYFIRFGDGAWHGTNAVKLMEAPLSPVCSPAIAKRLNTPGDLLEWPLLRSYRMDEWAMWFQAASLPAPRARGWMFDSSLTMVEAVTRDAGVALVPTSMFEHDLSTGRIVRPFPLEVTTGSYWLTWLKSRQETSAMQKFRVWLEGRFGSVKLTSAQTR
ncbi:LysR family transcriptional regulator [Roseibium sp. SCP14]|uniref:LysR family transcriptional regulator n=1 Tax=Roseibium sp. SCP14 TaxID=3141375 RepID=UPI0033374C49